MLLLAERLPRQSFDITFILLWERGAWADQADAMGIPVHVLGLRPPTRGGLRPRDVIVVARAIRTYLALVRHADIVDAWLVPSYTFAAFLQPLARVPVLMAGHRGSLALYEGKSWYRRAAAKWALRHVDALVANSQAGAAELIDREQIDPRRVHVVTNAVVPFEAPPPERQRRRSAWGFSADQIVVGCVANYKPGKGLGSLVEAAASLRDRAPAIRFVLVGEGPLRETLQRQIRNHDLETIVVLNGKAEDARLLYPAFDIAVQASDSEGTPNVVLEAAAAGLAIVATAVGGTPEFVRSGVDGLLVPSGDADRLAAAILRLAVDPALRARLAHNAQARSSEYSGQRLTERTAALYQQLAKV
jgi:glycosyltransferase involved in cell wall biosynthesis